MSLQSIIQQIKTATLPGENTALRVGSALEQMDSAKRNISDSLSTSETIDMLNTVKLLAATGTPFLGTIDPATTIPAGNFWAFASEGTYANAGGIVVGTGEIAIITRVGTVFDSVILDVPVKSINTISKTGTVGLVDTYTITYTDGSTPTTFEVKNGSTASPNLRLWSALPFSKDEQVVKDSVIYIALENVLATDVPGVSAKWKSLGSSISPQFDPTTTTEAQGGKQIAYWILANEKPAGASSDFEVVDEWTFNSKSVTGFQSNQYNTKSIQFIDAKGVNKLLLTMPTKLSAAEPGDVVYGKKLDGTFQTIYNLPNQNLNDFEVLIPQNTYLHIYVNSYWFTGQNTSGHLVKVFRGAGTQEKIYGDAKTVDALAKASKFFIEAGAGEEHTIVAGLSGQYSEGDAIYGSGSYRNILAYPATGVTKIKFTALTAAVTGEARPRTIYGKKADGSFESIMDFKEQNLVNFEVHIKPNYFTHLYVNYRVGSQPTEIDMIKEVDSTNSIKKFIENNGGGSGISLGNTFISAESAGLSTTKTASENTALLNQLLEDNKSLGGALYFNRGNFTLNDTIQVPNTIQLIGTGRSGTCFTALNGLQNKPMFNVFKVAGGDTNAGMNGFSLEGNNIARRGIQINSPSAFFEYHDFNLWSFTDYAIFSDGGLIFALRNIRIGGGNGGVNITGSPTHFANHIKFQDVQFGSIKKLGVNIQTGANIEFDHCDWEQNGTTGDATTGNVRAASLSVLGEGVDLTFNNCWSEIVNGGFWLNLSGASGVTTFRDSMVWQVGGGTAPVGIINNGSKVLLTGSTKLQGFTTDIRTTNNGQTRVDGFANVGTHAETTGGTFKTNNASYI